MFQRGLPLYRHGRSSQSRVVLSTAVTKKSAFPRDSRLLSSAVMWYLLLTLCEFLEPRCKTGRQHWSTDMALLPHFSPPPLYFRRLSRPLLPYRSTNRGHTGRVGWVGHPLLRCLPSKLLSRAGLGTPRPRQQRSQRMMHMHTYVNTNTEVRFHM